MKPGIPIVDSRSNHPALPYIMEGDALKAAGKFDAALECYQKALAFPPTEYTSRVYFSIGNCWREKRQHEKAIEYYNQCIALEPGFAQAYFGRGISIYESRGFVVEMHQDFERGFSIMGDDADMLLCVGIIYYQENHFGEAIHLLNSAIKLRPAFAEAWIMLARCYLAQGNILVAKTIFENVVNLYPDNASATINLALLLPAIAQSDSDIDAWRQRLLHNFDTLIKRNFRIPETELYTMRLPFFQGYHGRNNKELMQKMAQFFLHCYPALNYTAPHCQKPRTIGAKIRLGIVSDFFDKNLLDQFFGEIIKGLDADGGFEIILFSNSSRTTVKVGNTVSAAYKYIALPDNPQEAQRIAAREEIDIMMYLEIGQSLQSYLLALGRLAPIQVLMPGHPITSGMPSMDYFFSCRDMEPADAQEHYTEKLIACDKLPIIFHRRPLPQGTKSRAELGLPENVILYTCPVTLFKLHPDLDKVFAGILERDPKACILLFHNDLPLWKTQLENRFAATMPPDMAKRIVFIPHAPGDKFYHILRAVDCVIDTMHYGFGTTAYLLLSANIPYITLPGAFLRGRVSYSQFQKMELPELIASSPQHFSELAVKLANDKAFYADMAEKIRTRSDRIFDDTNVVSELVQHLKRLT